MMDNTIQNAQEIKSYIIFRVHRPFFDLQTVTEAPLTSKVPLIMYGCLDNEEVIDAHSYMTERFRFSLIAESGLSQYARLTPSEVQEAYRTPQWQRLCDLTENFFSLSVIRQLSVLRLLRALCFHRLILKLVPAHLSTSIKDEQTGEMAYLRAFVRYLLHARAADYSMSDFEEIIHQMPVLSHARYSAAINLLVHSAKIHKDLAAVRHYREIAQPYVNAPHHDKDSFAYYILKSAFFRAASLEPFLEGNQARLAGEMSLAEEFARIAPARTETEHFIAQEHLYAVLESRMREAISVGDLNLAQLRLEENMRINPWSAKAHIEMGEVLMRQGNLPGAAAEYIRATELSPPGSALSYYMAGYCYEHLGEPEQANDLYLSSLQIDPAGISPVQGLLRTAKRTGKQALLHWAVEKAEHLAKSGHIAQQELLF